MKWFDGVVGYHICLTSLTGERTEGPEIESQSNHVLFASLNHIFPFCHCNTIHMNTWLLEFSFFVFLIWVQAHVDLNFNSCHHDDSGMEHWGASNR